MKPKLVLVTTVPVSFLTLLRGQARYLAQYFDVTIVSSPGTLLNSVAEYEDVPTIAINMKRAITPVADFTAATRLAMLFASLRPDIVQTYTPKAGLVGQLAACAARVPRRVHGIVGLKMMGSAGIQRRVLAATERLTYTCATHLTANSFGLRDWIHSNSLTRSAIDVVSNGSINGVDTEFYRDVWSSDEKNSLRSELGIGQDEFVFLFVGRIVRDKGVGEMLRAFEAVVSRHQNARLLLVGDEDDGLDSIDDGARAILQTHPSISRTGFVQDVRPFLAISDTLILASYREGLPNSVIEAGAMGLPCIVSNINGCNEVVIDGDNGFIIPPKTVEPLAQCMAQMMTSPHLVAAMSASARQSVVRRFNQKMFWGELRQYYDRLLGLV